MSVSAPTPVVPIDWEIAKTGEVCEVQNGYAFKSEFFNDKSTGLPLIRIRDVHSGRSDTFYSGSYDERYVVTDDDLLIGMDGEFRVRKWRSGKGLLNQRVCRLIPNGESMTADFLYYSIGRPLKQIEDFTPFTTVKHISAGQIRAIELPLPPLPEQKKIAHILSTVQRAIEAQERIIQTTTELKKALMHKLFTEGLRHEPQKQTEIGPVPESWDVAKLGKHIQIAHGYAFKGEFFVNDGPTVLTPGNFKLDGGLYWGKRTKYTTEDYEPNVVLNPGELVVVMTDLTPTAKLLGGPAFIPEGRTILHNQRIGKVELKGARTTLQFLYWVFLSESFKRYMRQTATGSTVRHTSPSKIYQYAFGLPSLEEQAQAVDCLAKVDAKLANAEDKKRALEDLFRTLLHELMTAKIRVHQLEVSA
jgi:type I restriction enzyme S subunit